MAREVSVDERPGHYRREVIGRADRVENRLAVALQIRSLVPDARLRGLAHGISMSDPSEPIAIRPNTRSALFWGPVVLAVGSGTIENSKYAPTWPIKSAKQASTDSHRTTGRTIANMVSLPWRNVHPATAAIAYL